MPKWVKWPRFNEGSTTCDDMIGLLIVDTGGHKERPQDSSAPNENGRWATTPPHPHWPLDSAFHLPVPNSKK